MSEGASKLPSRLPQPGLRRAVGIPRPMQGSCSTMTKRVTRQSMSAPDLRVVGAKPAAASGAQARRNVPARAPISTAQRNAQPSSVTAGVNRKRPAAVATAVPAKKPLVQIDGNKQNKPASAERVAPQNPANKQRKVAAWDTKGQLELANKKIERLQQEKENLEHASVQLPILTEELDVCRREKERVNNDLKEARKKIKENEGLSMECGHLRAEVECLQKRGKELDMKIEQLASDLAAANEKIRDLQSKEHILKEELTRERSVVKNLTDRLQEAADKERQHLDDIFKLNQLRRIMHNQILDLKGNVRVFCRVRPPLDQENDKPICAFDFPDDGSLEVKSSQDTQNARQKKLDKASFSYDKVFPPNSGQSDIYEELSQLVQSALDGYNVCVFAYGQTGSGKTYTMEGGTDPDSQGMIPRAVKTIFESIAVQENLGWQFTVKCSFLEIYNETIRDLLNPNCNLPHEVKMLDTNSEDVYVSNLKVETVPSIDALEVLIAKAQKNRFVAATVMNEHSSRSHSITQLKVEGKNSTQRTEIRSTLNLIDLAGSERYRSENQSDRKTETCSINKSLASLSLVVLKLAEKAEHIPFRDSKLTHLLMPSLKGNSKTLMLVNIAPFEDCFHETLSSLRFASRVSRVKVDSKRQVKSSVSGLASCKPRQADVCQRQ
ncbi:hypothetical protein ONE63_005664 [Megalurothrips usitatus]|uniref:Kinesin-like protein n=1 Tax=Megalurothrips usitatus TaxID=439358 RepID=A0AAV7XW96_9NEOP|nr:hypothetical protein ONE63_005664 [Megalurothrips usitatus]